MDQHLREIHEVNQHGAGGVGRQRGAVGELGAVSHLRQRSEDSFAVDGPPEDINMSMLAWEATAVDQTHRAIEDAVARTNARVTSYLATTSERRGDGSSSSSRRRRRQVSDNEASEWNGTASASRTPGRQRASAGGYPQRNGFR